MQATSPWKMIAVGFLGLFAANQASAETRWERLENAFTAVSTSDTDFFEEDAIWGGKCVFHADQVQPASLVVFVSEDDVLGKAVNLVDSYFSADENYYTTGNVTETELDDLARTQRRRLSFDRITEVVALEGGMLGYKSEREVDDVFGRVVVRTQRYVRLATLPNGEPVIYLQLQYRDEVKALCYYSKKLR